MFALPLEVEVEVAPFPSQRATSYGSKPHLPWAAWISIPQIPFRLGILGSPLYKSEVICITLKKVLPIFNLLWSFAKYWLKHWKLYGSYYIDVSSSSSFKYLSFQNYKIIVEDTKRSDKSSCPNFSMKRLLKWIDL